MCIQTCFGPLWRYCLQGGGGGNFGIVTSFTVRPIKLPQVVTLVTAQWPGSAYEAAMRWYMQKMPGLDPDFSSDLFVGYDSAQASTAEHVLFNAGHRFLPK